VARSWLRVTNFLELRTGEVRAEGRAGNAGNARKPRPGGLTKELQWHNDQHEEHHYDYHRGKRFPAHYTPPSLVVGYLDSQLKGQSPAKLGPRSVLLMGSSPPDPVLSGAPACGPPAPRA
jgi:hypothetical protein